MESLSPYEVVKMLDSLRLLPYKEIKTLDYLRGIFAAIRGNKNDVLPKRDPCRLTM